MHVHVATGTLHGLDWMMKPPSSSACQRNLSIVLESPFQCNTEHVVVTVEAFKVFLYGIHLVSMTE
jgi:hypothetical protein